MGRRGCAAAGCREKADFHIYRPQCDAVNGKGDLERYFETLKFSFLGVVVVVVVQCLKLLYF